MLLEELALSDLTLLSKALASMDELPGTWATLEKAAYNLEALKEAVRLYNWAIKESTGFSAQYQALSIVLSTRSTAGTRSALRVLHTCGFVKTPLVDRLFIASVTAEKDAFKTARAEAVPFIKAVRQLFYHLKVLGDVATEGTLWNEKNSNLKQKIARETLKRLGIDGFPSFFVTA